MARTITRRRPKIASAFVIASVMCAPIPANAGTLAANRAPSTEDCVAIEPMTVAAANTNGVWTVTLGTSAPLDFGANEAQAERAVAVIQHYHFTRECFVRRPNPHMMYWRNGVAVPPGNMPDQDCIAVNPAAVDVQWVNGGWKVLDGPNWLLDYGVDRAAADQAVAIIRAYNLNRECFVARPHVTMQYWLAQ
jgi:hypothetical protein